jgi:hypothetical protein
LTTKNQEKHVRNITEFTPYEQLFMFYSENSNIWGGAFTLDYLKDRLTVSEFDKFWVIEKLVQNDVLIKLSIKAGDSDVYAISRGVEKTFLWLMESKRVLTK